MDKKDKQLYDKAMKLYSTGYINRALMACDKAINRSEKNSAAYNLKGIIYYEKGNLTSALNIWKVNVSLNRDDISEMYINDSREDKFRMEAYKEAIVEIKKLNIHEAINKLNYCAESDFNMINVYNSLCLCAIKTGDFEKAQEYLEKVMFVDKNNKTALENKKILNEYGGNRNYSFIKKLCIPVAVIIAVIGAFAFTVPKIKNYTAARKVDQTAKAAEEAKRKVEEAKKQEAAKKQEQAKKEEVKEESKKGAKTIDASKLLTAIDDGDYKYVEKSITDVDKNFLGITERNAYDKAEAYMNDKGVVKLYEDGTKLFKAGKYNKAEAVLLNAYKYSNSSYLKPHIQFIIANNYEKMNNIEEAVKYFEEYEKENKDKTKEEANYMEEVLYKLAVYYKSTNAEKSKKYAEELCDKYPDSMYINTNIKDILK